MPDKPALTLLMEAFALPTSTWTTSSSLLSAMGAVRYYVFRWMATFQRMNWNSTPSAGVFQRGNLRSTRNAIVRSSYQLEREPEQEITLIVVGP